MKKCDLKIGYLVKLRNGELSLVLPDINDNLILVEKNTGFIPLDDYDDNLYCTPIDDPEVAEFDIIEVHDRSTLQCSLNWYTTNDRKLLWVRDELDVIHSKYGVFAVTQKGLESAISKIDKLQNELFLVKEENVMLRNKIINAKFQGEL